MNVEVEDLGPCQKKLKIQISPKEVNDEYQSVILELRKNVIIPGFRKGRASINTIRRQFKRQISDEVKEKLLERTLKDALIQQEISPVGPPSLDVKNVKVVENQPVEYEVEVEYIPPIELTDYKGVEMTKPPLAEVTEADVNRALEVLQRQNTMYEPTEDDHRIAENNSVTINYSRTVDGELFGKPVENYTFWLGVDPTIPELNQHVLGKKKGDHIEFSIQYGEEIQNKVLAGKTVRFVVDIVNVEKVVLPELDDEFAKDLEQDSLAALKEKLRQDIRDRFEQDAIRDVKNRILMKLADDHVFDVPPSLVKEQKKKYPGKEEEEIKKMLRAGIILGKIQRQEDITVSEEEVESMVGKLAMQNQMPLATMKEYLDKQGGIEQVRSDMIEAKTLDLLYEHAKIVEEK